MSSICTQKDSLANLASARDSRNLIADRLKKTFSAVLRKGPDRPEGRSRPARALSAVCARRVRAWAAPWPGPRSEAPPAAPRWRASPAPCASRSSPCAGTRVYLLCAVNHQHMAGWIAIVSKREPNFSMIPPPMVLFDRSPLFVSEVCYILESFQMVCKLNTWNAICFTKNLSLIILIYCIVHQWGCRTTIFSESFTNDSVIGIIPTNAAEQLIGDTYRIPFLRTYKSAILSAIIVEYINRAVKSVNTQEDLTCRSCRGRPSYCGSSPASPQDRSACIKVRFIVKKKQEFTANNI